MFNDCDTEVVVCLRGCRDCMIVDFANTFFFVPVQSVSSTTKDVSLNPCYGEVYSIQHYVIKIVSDMRQIGSFLRVIQFPHSIKLTATI